MMLLRQQKIGSRDWIQIWFWIHAFFSKTSVERILGKQREKDLLSTDLNPVDEKQTAWPKNTWHYLQSWCKWVKMRPAFFFPLSCDFSNSNNYLSKEYWIFTDSRWQFFGGEVSGIFKPLLEYVDCLYTQRQSPHEPTVWVLLSCSA